MFVGECDNVNGNVNGVNYTSPACLNGPSCMFACSFVPIWLTNCMSVHPWHFWPFFSIFSPAWIYLIPNFRRLRSYRQQPVGFPGRYECIAHRRDFILNNSSRRLPRLIGFKLDRFLSWALQQSWSSGFVAAALAVAPAVAALPLKLPLPCSDAVPAAVPATAPAVAPPLSLMLPRRCPCGCLHRFLCCCLCCCDTASSAPPEVAPAAVPSTLVPSLLLRQYPYYCPTPTRASATVPTATPTAALPLRRCSCLFSTAAK